MIRRAFLLLLPILVASLCEAFVPPHAHSRAAVHLQALARPQLDGKLAAAAAFVVANVVPAVALAEEEYEYGAVDAPIGIALVAGILAILTAALPVLLRGGEEAFDEIRERDKDTFGKGKDVLQKRK